MPRWMALVSFELRQQLREPLTALYAIIFALLCLGFISSGAVELVGDRHGVAKTAPWSLALAFGGLTAFGQVITTMVVATAFLRDSAMRTDLLLASSGVSARLWFSARLTAAVGVLCLVYAAMPMGALIGDATAGILHGRGAASVLADCTALSATLARTWLVITLPTCLIVAALLGASAVFTQRILGVFMMALTLVALWQLALGLEAHDQTRKLGALLDPFANAPVLAITRAWSDTERATRAVAWTGDLLWNRLIWLTVSIASVVSTAYRVRWDRLLAASAESSHRPSGVQSALHAVRPTRRGTQTPFRALASLTAAWMQRDGGWRAVVLLAAINAMANGWSRSTDSSTIADVLGLIAENSRLFLILLATVYAGEVLWRERDVRIDALTDTAPITTRTMAIGRLTGLFRAQLSVVVAITAAAMAVLLARVITASHGSAVEPTQLLQLPAWIVFVLWLPFAQLTALSVAVHAIVNHKVFAHLLLITGWVSAVVLDRNGASAWWYRFAEPAPLVAAGQVNWAALTVHALWWSACSVVLLGLAVVRWPRAATTSRR